tara:strand:- start:309 stop:425 length:117 start_codon:yes stop_codon:yes gene_type:complete
MKTAYAENEMNFFIRVSSVKFRFNELRISEFESAEHSE